MTSGDGTPGLTLDHLQEPPKTSSVQRLSAAVTARRSRRARRYSFRFRQSRVTNPPPTGSRMAPSTRRGRRTIRVFYTLTPLAADSNGNALDAGSVKALVGQKVGSQVLVVVPPKYGYPSR